MIPPAYRLYMAQAAITGMPTDRKNVDVYAIGFIADSDEVVRDAFYPGWGDL